MGDENESGSREGNRIYEQEDFFFPLVIVFLDSMTGNEVLKGAYVHSIHEKKTRFSLTSLVPRSAHLVFPFFSPRLGSVMAG